MSFGFRRRAISGPVICFLSWYLVGGDSQTHARSLETVGRAVRPAKAGPAMLAFEPNRGQFAHGIEFVAHGGGLTAALGGNTIAFSLASPARGTSELRMRVLGRSAAPRGSDRLPGEANYLIGSSSAWITGVPLYGRVAYTDVYPGVDVEYHGDARGRLQYDFIVDPGADPGVIRLAFEGARSLGLDAAGNLVVDSGGEALVQTAPIVYQAKPDGSRSAVSGSFALYGDGQVGFQVGAYDRSRPLVIDPVSLSYSTFLGTEVHEEARDVAIDAAGNVYVVGTRVQPFLDPSTPNTRDAFVAKYGATGSLVYLTYVGGQTGPPGPQGPGNDDGDGIAIGPISTIDPTIVAYITGGTTSTDFPIEGPAVQTALTHHPVDNPHGARQNVFLAKLNAHGTGLLYSTYIGRINFGQSKVINYRGQTFGVSDPFEEMSQFGRDVAVDAHAVAYVVGGTAGIQGSALAVDPPYPPKDAFHVADAFLHRVDLDPAGPAYGDATLRWNLFANLAPGLFGNDYAAQGDEIATGVALSPDRDVFVTGHSSSTDLYTSHGALRADATDNLGSEPNLADSFVVQFDGPDADAPDDTGIVGGFEYATYLGGGGDDSAFAIAVDPLEHAFVTGRTTRDSFPTTAGAYQRTSTSQPILEGAAFVSKLNEAGSTLGYSTLLGGNTTVGLGVALDDLSRAYVTGESRNPGSLEAGPPPSGGDFLPAGEDAVGTFPLTEDATDASTGTGPRAFLTALNVGGSSLLFSTFHGSQSSGQSVVVRIVSDEDTVLDREAVVAGWIDSDVMPVTSDAEQQTNGGCRDGFLAKWNGFGIPAVP
jgi:hypothetical protein